MPTIRTFFKGQKLRRQMVGLFGQRIKMMIGKATYMPLLHTMRSWTWGIPEGSLSRVADWKSRSKKGYKDMRKLLKKDCLPVY
jgi:hypothetical protein